MSAQHTPGPWRWEYKAKHKTIQLVGGGPGRQYDLTIVEPIRWGMGGAGLFVRDTSPDGHDLLHKLHERPDWIAPLPGREHHAHWCASVTHPDMRLIAAAPELLEALQGLVALHDSVYPEGLFRGLEYINARAAIAKAQGIYLPAGVTLEGRAEPKASGRAAT